MAAPFATLGDLYGPSAGGTLTGGYMGNNDSTSSATAAAQATPATPAIQSVNLFPSLQGINPLIWVPVLIVVAIAIKMLREHGEGEKEVADLKIGAYAMVTIYLLDRIATAIFKPIFNKYQVPGLTALVNA